MPSVKSIRKIAYSYSPPTPPPCDTPPPLTPPSPPLSPPPLNPHPPPPSPSPPPWTTPPPKSPPGSGSAPPKTQPESPYYPPSPVKPPKPETLASPPQYLHPPTKPGAPSYPPNDHFPPIAPSPYFPPTPDALTPFSDPSNTRVTPLPGGRGGNNHTTIIAVCVSLGGLFFLTFIAVGLFCLVKKKKKPILVPAAADAAALCEPEEPRPGPYGGEAGGTAVTGHAHGGGEISGAGGEIRAPELVLRESLDQVTYSESLDADKKQFLDLSKEQALYDTELCSYEPSDHLPVVASAIMGDEFPGMLEPVVAQKGKKGKAIAGTFGQEKNRSPATRDGVEEEATLRRPRMEVGASPPLVRQTRALAPLLAHTAIVPGKGMFSEMGTYLGISSDWATGIEQMLGNSPSIPKEYYQTNSPTPTTMRKRRPSLRCPMCGEDRSRSVGIKAPDEGPLPNDIQEDMELPAQAGNPRQESYVQNMTAIEMRKTALAHLECGLDFFVRSNEKTAEEFRASDDKFSEMKSTAVQEMNRASNTQTKPESSKKKNAELKKPVEDLRKELADKEAALEDSKAKAWAEVEEAKEKALKEYKTSRELDAFLNRVFATTYVMAIAKIKDKTPDYDVGYLNDYVAAYCMANGLKDISGFETKEAGPSTQVEEGAATTGEETYSEAAPEEAPAA